MICFLGRWREAGKLRGLGWVGEGAGVGGGGGHMKVGGVQGTEAMKEEGPDHNVEAGDETWKKRRGQDGGD